MQFFPPMRNAFGNLRQGQISSETHFPYGSHNYFIILRISSNGGAGTIQAQGTANDNRIHR